MKLYIKFLIATFFILISNAFATSEDCSFCKKDHQNICESECMDENHQYGKGDDCQPKCVDIKCKSACEEKVKSKEEKSDKAKEAKAAVTPKA